MKIVKIKRHPFGGDFTAINLFGVIFTLKDLSPSELNHELIHTAQQRELLYVPFFIWLNCTPKVRHKTFGMLYV